MICRKNDWIYSKQTNIKLVKQYLGYYLIHGNSQSCPNKYTEILECNPLSKEYTTAKQDTSRKHS